MPLRTTIPAVYPGYSGSELTIQFTAEEEAMFLPEGFEVEVVAGVFYQTLEACRLEPGGSAHVRVEPVPAVPTVRSEITGGSLHVHVEPGPATMAVVVHAPNMEHTYHPGDLFEIRSAPFTVPAGGSAEIRVQASPPLRGRSEIEVLGPDDPNQEPLGLPMHENTGAGVLARAVRHGLAAVDRAMGPDQQPNGLSIHEIRHGIADGRAVEPECVTTLCWFRIGIEDGNQTLVSNPDCDIHINDGHVVVKFGEVTIATSGRYNDGYWHQVIAGTNAVIYVDGCRQTMTLGSVPVPVGPQRNSALIYDIAVLNRAVSIQDVRTLYNGGMNEVGLLMRHPAFLSNLVAYFPASYATDPPILARRPIGGKSRWVRLMDDEPIYKPPSEAEEAERDRRAVIAAHHGYRGPQSETT